MDATGIVLRRRLGDAGITAARDMREMNNIMDATKDDVVRSVRVICNTDVVDKRETGRTPPLVKLRVGADIGGTALAADTREMSRVSYFSGFNTSLMHFARQTTERLVKYFGV